MPDDVIVNQGEPVLPPEIVAAVAEAQVAEAEASVERAEIHADAETEQARIHAEREVAVAEVNAEIVTAITREELDECRTNSAMALRLSQENNSAMQQILERLTPPPPNPPEPPANVADAHPVQPTAESPPEPVKKKPAIRWT